MIRRPLRSTLDRSAAASDGYKRQANTDPAWSPDGAFIAYVRGKESDYAFFSFYLMIIRPDGSDARQLTQPDEAIIDPTWPADSQSVYFLSLIHISEPTRPH